MSASAYSDIAHLTMEPDRLASNANLLGDVAKAAITFRVSHMCSLAHADLLKVQMSCGNYLLSTSLLLVCTV